MTWQQAFSAAVGLALIVLNAKFILDLTDEWELPKSDWARAAGALASDAMFVGFALVLMASGIKRLATVLLAVWP